jgi:integrase
MAESLPINLITFKIVKGVRDRYAATPRKAHKIRQMMSRLYSWAAESDLIDPDINPAAKIKRLKIRSRSIVPWSEEEIMLFLNRMRRSGSGRLCCSRYTLASGAKMSCE